MRIILQTCFLFISLSSLSQKQVVADTFSKWLMPRSFNEIILRNDFSFSSYSAGCGYPRTNVGIWKIREDSIDLLYFKQAVSVTKETYSFEEQDTTVTFFVCDVNGNPLRKYYITLGQDYCCDTSIATDNNGKLIIRRGQYSGFFTETDETKVDWVNITENDLSRHIAPNVKSIQVKVSIDSSATCENINPYYYRSTYSFSDKGILLDKYRVYDRIGPQHINWRDIMLRKR